MAQGSTARRPVGYQVPYIRAHITGAEGPRTIKVGTIPAGSVLLRGTMAVAEEFNGTSPTADIGTADDGDLFLSGGDIIDTKGIITITLIGDEKRIVAVDTDIYITLTGANMNAGVGDLILEFIPPDE